MEGGVSPKRAISKGVCAETCSEPAGELPYVESNTVGGVRFDGIGDARGLSIDSAVRGKSYEN